MSEDLEAFIASARWFGGKGRPFHVAQVHRLGWLGRDGGAQETGAQGGQARDADAPERAEDLPSVRIELVTVEYDDGGSEVYQVPLAYYGEPPARLEHALVGQWDDEELGPVSVYDALQDRAATRLWLTAFDEARSDDELVFHRLPGHDLDLEAQSSLFSGEQSNSSLRFGDEVLLKVFRKVNTGQNPDIEIHAALTQAENEHVAALYGWLEACPRDGGDPLQLAMLQQFLRTASDGWDLALASVRDLFAEADLHADEVGGDFAAEAHRLGVATAEVHAALAECFPTSTWGRDQLDGLRGDMEARLDAALDVAPDLAEHADALRAVFDAVREIDEPVVVQRIHGDFHLGQTLRTVKNWKIVDFEGEPAKPLAERVRPDSVWRDVAGMLRSFDYAAHAMEVDVEEAGHQIAYRAAEWSERNRTAFLDGYAEGSGRTEDGRLTPGQQLLLRAYEVDKAVYETVYEARNRPDWINIPLAAIARLARTDVEQETRNR